MRGTRCRTCLLLVACVAFATGCATHSARTVGDSPHQQQLLRPASWARPQAQPAQSNENTAVIRGQNPTYPVTVQNEPTPGAGSHFRHPMAPSGQQAFPFNNIQPVQYPSTAAPVSGPYPAHPVPAQGTWSPPAGSYEPPPGAITDPRLSPAPGSNAPGAGVYTSPPPNVSPVYPGSGVDGPYLQSSSGTYVPGTYPYTMPPAVPPSTLPNLGPNSGMFADVDVLLQEAQTGRFMFGVGINSDAGVMGNIVIDERNFDLFRPPRSWSDFGQGTAFRGGGQGFRLEALPGSEIQRYSVSLTEPYFLGTQVSFNVSGYLYDRRFFDWSEGRAGGRVGFGYRVTPDLSIGLKLRAEEVRIYDPISIAEPQLNAAVGNHHLYSARVSASHDTRDVAFAPTEGHLIEVSYEQVFGSFEYPRGSIDLRRYFLTGEREDGSGRHVLGFSFRTGITGSNTPIFENYFAGGYSTLRGFKFRGASPVGADGVNTGGEFMLIGSGEYIFPLTADDMIRGVVFVDYGTVEEQVQIKSGSFRVAPGFGLRISVPAMGPAPIALDFGFPIEKAATDEEQMFSFFIGFAR